MRTFFNQTLSYLPYSLHIMEQNVKKAIIRSKTDLANSNSQENPVISTVKIDQTQLAQHLKAIRSEIKDLFVMVRNGPDKNRYQQDEDRLLAKLLEFDLIEELKKLTLEEIGKILYATNLQIGKNCDEKYDGAVYTAVLYAAEQKQLFVNTVGDCNAVIIKWSNEKNKFEIEQINQIHDLTNQKEQKRLLTAKTDNINLYLYKKSTFVINNETYELTNKLSPTRSIGDSIYPKELGGTMKMKCSGLKYEGELGTTTIDDPDKTFLLLSTDGLNSIDLFELQEFINQMTLDDFKDKNNLEAKMKQLMEKGIKQYPTKSDRPLESIDNISFIVAPLEKSFVALAIDGHGCDKIVSIMKNPNGFIKPKTEKMEPETAKYIEKNYMTIFKEKINLFVDDKILFEKTLMELKNAEKEFSAITEKSEEIKYSEQENYSSDSDSDSDIEIEKIDEENEWLQYIASSDEEYSSDSDYKEIQNLTNRLWDQSQSEKKKSSKDQKKFPTLGSP